MVFPYIWELQMLVGEKVVAINRKTGESWKYSILNEYKITRDTVIAIVSEEFNIEIDLRDFYLTKQN